MRLLEEQGHIVTAASLASEGNAAWVEWNKGESDIILMDIQMPKVNGFEATASSGQREKSTGRHIPIVALTAHAMKDDRERSFSAGLEAYITKPIRANEPYATIEGLLEARVKA